jgi:hypothetical protein
MSPLQFQKCLRLQEAKRLKLTEHLNAAPPLRDIKSLNQIAVEVRG